MRFDSSEQKNNTDFDTSLGDTIFFNGVSFTIISFNLFGYFSVSGVSKIDGEIELHVIPYGPNSTASDFVNPNRAYFDII